jgi:hypothetical protein
MILTGHSAEVGAENVRREQAMEAARHPQVRPPIKRRRR